MRLTALTIKNFKGIDERGVRIEFAPITLLFGPNNAGKSTVIQALHLAREVFCHPNMDLDKVEVQGKGVDLGGFQDYVHKRQLDRVVRIGLEIETHSLPACDDDLYLQALDGWQIVDDLLHQVQSCAVEIGVRWNREKAKAELTECAIFLNGTRFTDMHIYPQVSTTISLCNTIAFLQEESVPLLKEQAERLWGYIDAHPDDYGNEFLDLRDAIKDALPEFVRPFTDLHRLVLELGGPDLSLDEDQRTIETSLAEKPTPEWGCPLSMQYQDMDPDYDPEEIPHDFITNCLSLFSSLVLGPGGLVREALHNFLYIGPLRSIPERREFRTHKPSNERWAEGLAAWDMLAVATDDLLEAVNRRLNSSEFLTTGYTVARKRSLPLDAEGPLALALRQSLLEDFDENALPLLREFLEQSPEIRITLRNENTGVEVEPHDMGVGISQIIPIVVAATFPKRGAVIAMEQPELHIHPAWQTALGDIFIQAVHKENPPLFLLETHSEHLLLRLLRRIRNTHKGTAADSTRLTHTDLAVHWIGAYEGRTEVYRLGLDEGGSFNTPWPEGFFDERGEELFG